MSIIRTYSELIKLPTFIERYQYLKLNGRVGEDTFGYDRYLNQIFYKSDEWLEVRDYVIVRDMGCDLGIIDREIQGIIHVHHMNSISKEDILRRTDILLDPEFLVCTSDRTHKAIHYSDAGLLLINEPIIRTKNDTCPWKR